MKTLPSTSRTNEPDASSTAIGKCRPYTRAFDSRLLLPGQQRGRSRPR